MINIILYCYCLNYPNVSPEAWLQIRKNNRKGGLAGAKGIIFTDIIANAERKPKKDCL